jgi:hypothetical protein
MKKILDLLKLLVPPVAAMFVAAISDAGSFVEMASSLAGVALLIPIITEFFKTAFNLDGKVIWNIKVPRAISWATGIMLSMLSYYAGWGYFAELTAWYMPIIAGLGAGLVANGYFTLEMVQTVLKIIFDTLRAKTTTEAPVEVEEEV